MKIKGIQLVLTLMLFFMTADSVAAQKRGFIVQNGIKYQRGGIQFENGKNDYSRVKIENKEGVFFYYPDEISAYKDERDNYYESFAITYDNLEVKYFLKLVSEDNFGKVYFCVDEKYNERLFLYQDELIELNNLESSNLYYKKVLAGLGDCRNKEEIIQHVNFSKESLVRTLKSLDDCSIKFSPKPELFFSAEYVNVNLKPNINVEEPLIVPKLLLTDISNKLNSLGLSVSVGYSIPIKKSKISFDQVLSYNSYEQTLFTLYSLANYQVDYKVKFIEYSPMFRVRSARNNWQTSLSVGPLIGLPLSNVTTLYSSTINPVTLGFLEQEQSLDNNEIQMGYKFKLQLESRIKENYSLGLFLSGGQLFLLQKNRSKFNLNRYSIGVSFGIWI